MTTKKQLSKEDIVEIFKKTETLYPQLLLDPSTGQKYTADHPAAEGIASIFKIKLDVFDHTQKQIEEGRKCLAAAGYSSMENFVKQNTLHRGFDYHDTYVSQRPSEPTLGDFMNTSTVSSKKRNRNHK